VITSARDGYHKTSFSQLVYASGAERHAEGFSSWDQLVAMLFCQFAQARSLREISDGLAVTCSKLNHLGLRGAPAKSTLAYANAHRPYQLSGRGWKMINKKRNLFYIWLTHPRQLCEAYLGQQ
jgi:hypothetical protein